MNSEEEAEEVFRDFYIIRVLCIVDCLFSILGSVGIIVWFVSYGTGFSWLMLMITALLMYLLQFAMSIKLLLVHRVCEERMAEYQRFSFKWLLVSLFIFSFIFFKLGFVLAKTDGPNLLWILFGAETIFRIIAIYFNIEFKDDLALYRPPKGSQPKPSSSASTSRGSD